MKLTHLTLACTVSFALPLAADEPASALPSEPTDTASGSSWKLIADNSAFQLREWQLSERKSLVHGVFFETDAQMGIAVAAQIGLLSESKKYPFFRFDHDAGKDDRFKPQLRELPKTNLEGVKYSQKFVVEFLKERPESDQNAPPEKRVMNAVVLAQIARMSRDQGTASEKQ